MNYSVDRLNSEREKNRNNVKNRRHLWKKDEYRFLKEKVRRAEISTIQWIMLCDMFNNKCACCGADGDFISLTVDHIIPKAIGGNGGVENIQPLCFTCNRKKGKKAIDYRALAINREV